MHKLSGYMDAGCEIDFSGLDGVTGIRPAVSESAGVAGERVGHRRVGDTLLGSGAIDLQPVDLGELEDFHSP